jgi:hypothetical protein
MKKIALLVALVILITALSNNIALAQSNPCGARAHLKNGLIPGLKGGGAGALIGALVAGGNGAKWAGLIGAGAGYAAGAIPKPKGCETVAQSKPQQSAASAQGKGFPGHINPSDRRTYSEDDSSLPAVYIRNVDGTDGGILRGLIGPALDGNKYSMLDPTQSPDLEDPGVYFVDVVVRQQDTTYNNNWTNISGNRGSINVNPGNGNQKFWVTVSTYRRGKFVRDLSAVNKPITVTLKSLNYNVNTRVGPISASNGGSGATYSVNPPVQAAEQAILTIFNLR